MESDWGDSTCSAEESDKTPAEVLKQDDLEFGFWAMC